MALQLLLMENRRALRRERVFRDRKNPLDEYNDVEMYKKYRFTRFGCLHVINRIEAELHHPTQRNHALPASLQVFIALRFYATGSLYDYAGEMQGCSIATCSRVVRRVTPVLCRLRNELIQFPTTPVAVREMQRDLFGLSGFPELVGVVDGTHIGLHGCNLGNNEHIYVNRKGRHTINVQVVCDAHFKITNVVARWPGSTHDSRIFQASRIGQLFQRQELQGILLGDSGYALQPWLMTPLLNPATDAERAYYRAHAHTRVVIEQVNGQLKNKFRCLLGHGMQIVPERACDIIIACCVLFNISKLLKEPHLDPENDQEDEEDDNEDVEEDEVVAGVTGASVRARIITNCFG
ncbi:putative nuclease HARBI1 [Patiria miniata]|uniref:Putative nuclease HARBI1 n=1 Tax=Patiria miniata TaxID=46514 RepID=A0A914AHU5_PATMI|nr:putative nuclease HARBI1 [Patiria miniata]